MAINTIGGAKEESSRLSPKEIYNFLDDVFLNMKMVFVSGGELSTKQKSKYQEFLKTGDDSFLQDAPMYSFEGFLLEHYKIETIEQFFDEMKKHQEDNLFIGVLFYFLSFAGQKYMYNIYPDLIGYGEQFAVLKTMQHIKNIIKSYGIDITDAAFEMRFYEGYPTIKAELTDYFYGLGSWMNTDGSSTDYGLQDDDIFVPDEEKFEDYAPNLEFSDDFVQQVFANAVELTGANIQDISDMKDSSIQSQTVFKKYVDLIIKDLVRTVIDTLQDNFLVETSHYTESSITNVVLNGLIQILRKNDLMVSVNQDLLTHILGYILEYKGQTFLNLKALTDNIKEEIFQAFEEQYPDLVHAVDREQLETITESSKPPQYDISQVLDLDGFHQKFNPEYVLTKALRETQKELSNTDYEDIWDLSRKFEYNAFIFYFVANFAMSVTDYVFDERTYFACLNSKSMPDDVVLYTYIASMIKQSVFETLNISLDDKVFEYNFHPKKGNIRQQIFARLLSLRGLGFVDPAKYHNNLIRHWAQSRLADEGIE